MSTFQILHTQWLDGPNLWADRPCMQVVLHHNASQPLDMAQQRAAVEHIAQATMQLHQQAGQAVKYFAVEQHGQGDHLLVFRSPDRRVAQLCLSVALDRWHAQHDGRTLDEAEQFKTIQNAVDQHAFGPSTNHIVEAAYRRNIPAIRLNDGNLVQLGYGALQQRIWTAETSRTSAIAEYVACEKPLCKSLLSQCGVPVPQGVVADTPETAWEAAQDIGLPVVVKPTDGNHSRGVSLDLRTEADVHKAWALANDEGSEVIVEQFIPGVEHRVLVVAGKVQAVARGEVFEVVGNGQHTVAELVDQQINQDPRRGDAEEFPLETIRFAENPLALLEIQRQGFEPHSVPAAGQRVLVQRNGTASEDVTDLIHPSIAQMCELSAKVVGLDIAGIDLVCEDISKSLDQQAAGVVEVNAGPGLLMHLKPSKGTPRDLGTPIVESLFPTSEVGEYAGQIPIVCFASEGIAQFGDRMAKVLRARGLRTVLHNHQGMWLEDEFTPASVSTSLDQLARRSLTSKHIDAALFELAPAALTNQGLPFNRPTVLVASSVAFGAAPGAQTASKPVVDAPPALQCWATLAGLLHASGLLLIHADQPELLDLQQHTQAQVVYVSERGESAAVKTLIQAGHRVVVQQGLTLQLHQGGKLLQEISREGPFGAVTAPLEDLCLLAATWGLGIDLAFFYVSMSMNRAPALAA